MLFTFLKQKNLLMTLSLLGALAGSVWLMHTSFLNTENVNISQPTTPDAFMTQADYKRFDAQGNWSGHVQASRVVHYPDQDTSLFDLPKMIFRSNNTTTWKLSANHGTARHGISVLHLKDDVVIDKVNAVQGSVLTLHTTTLTTYPQERFAETDQPVTIIQPGSVVDAVGLTADMNTGDIHLLSQVKGTYSART